MSFPFTIEFNPDSVFRVSKFYIGNKKDRESLITAMKGVIWVARVTGFDPKYLLARSFLRWNSLNYNTNILTREPVADATYLLEEGELYEIKTAGHRTYCVVKDSLIQQLNREQFFELLRKREEEEKQQIKNVEAKLKASAKFRFIFKG